jgi:signal transduction histidine kinase
MRATLSASFTAAALRFHRHVGGDFTMATMNVRAATAAAFLAVALSACATQSATETEAAPAMETQRVTTALASEASVEIGKCIADSATAIAQRPSSPEPGVDAIAEAALSQCEHLLNEYESNDRALVLAADPDDGVPFADQHAKESKSVMLQSVRSRAVELAREERAKLAQQ